MKDYFKVQEGQEINSLQDVYLTHSTIMINLIDTDTYDSMMLKVVKDIYENDEIVEITKKLRRKDRLFLGKLIYTWARKEWNNHPSLPQPTYTRGTYGWVRQGKSPYRIFLDRFADAFHEDILDEAEYQYLAAILDFRVSEKDNTYNIVMYESDNQWYQDIFGRMIVKYNEKANTLKICYIEKIEWKSKWNKMTPQRFRIEMFRQVRNIMNRILEVKSKEPKVTCHKKYKALLDKAIEKGYLTKKEPKIDSIYL